MRRFFPMSCIFFVTILTSFVCMAQPIADAALPRPTLSKPKVIPVAPTLSARSYFLMDFHSGQALAAKDPDQPMPPASTTKLMTMYVIDQAMKEGKLKDTDLITISEAAWRTGGSKMFVEIGKQIPAADLVQGIIVQSGNDACIAMAEHLAGSEAAFAELMNQYAQHLGMTQTHFTNATGLPDPAQKTTARDLALLAQAIIKGNSPSYALYAQKWFVYHGIKQPNRNRLLWRDPSVDGLKTGHTEEAGFCLVASALRDKMRLISVVMGADSDNMRTDDSAALLNYGFRTFETRPIFAAQQTLIQSKVWYGQSSQAALGLAEPLYLTMPQGDFEGLTASLSLDTPLQAPLMVGQSYGKLQFRLKDKPEVFLEKPLVALQEVPEGNIFTRLKDMLLIRLSKPQEPVALALT